MKITVFRAGAFRTICIGVQAAARRRLFTVAGVYMCDCGGGRLNGVKLYMTPDEALCRLDPQRFNYCTSDQWQEILSSPELILSGTVRKHSTLHMSTALATT
jgi:hypothetical protein